MSADRTRQSSHTIVTAGILLAIPVLALLIVPTVVA